MVATACHYSALDDHAGGAGSYSMLEASGPCSNSVPGDGGGDGAAADGGESSCSAPVLVADSSWALEGLILGASR